MFVRVEDKDTGHRYDVWETAVDPKAHRVLDLKGYPPSDRPRPAKHRTDMAGRPARPVGRPAKTDKE